MLTLQGCFKDSNNFMIHMKCFERANVLHTQVLRIIGGVCVLARIRSVCTELLQLHMFSLTVGRYGNSLCFDSNKINIQAVVLCVSILSTCV